MDGLAIAASLTELRAAVEGGFVRSVYEPVQGMVVLHVFGDRKRRILISPKHSSLHATELDIANPDEPSTYAMLLRKHLRGGRIRRLRQAGLDRIVVLEIERRDAAGLHEYELVLELIGLRGNIVLLEDGRVAGALRSDARCRIGEAYQPLPGQPRTPVANIDVAMLQGILEGEQPDRSLARLVDGLSRESARDALAGQTLSGLDAAARSVRARLRVMVDGIEAPQGHFDPERGRAAWYPLPPPAWATGSFSEAVDRAIDAAGLLSDDAKEDRATKTRIQKELGRRKRTIVKLEKWLSDASEADRLTSRADLLMIYHREVPPKARSITLEDPATEAAVEIPLDPSRTAIENAQKLYERAKRMRRGVPRVEARLERLRREVTCLEEALAATMAGGDLSEAVTQLLALPKRTKPQPAPASPRTVEVEGYPILVGRSAAENDRLVREADPNDLWMHVRRYAGSHVIVQTRGAEDVPDAVLLTAARLAGRNSKAGKERRVEVTVARVKHLRKPKGAPPGLVIVDRADTLTVDLDEKETP